MHNKQERVQLTIAIMVLTRTCWILCCTI